MPLELDLEERQVQSQKDYKPSSTRSINFFLSVALQACNLLEMTAKQKSDMLTERMVCNI